MQWVQQNPELATALIAACSALVGGLVAAAAKFVFDFYLSERIKRRWKIIDSKRQYAVQIIRSVDDLAARIANISRHIEDGTATTWLRPLSEEEGKNIPFKRYYFSSTIYLFCRLIAWIEVLKREQIFLDFASTRETRQFNANLELIYSIVSYSGLTGSGSERESKNHWIYYHYLGGVGNALFVKEGGRGKLQCITFHEFCLKYKDASNDDFRAWVKEAERLFCDLSSKEDCRWDRLQMLWFCLDQFLRFADPDSLRTTRDRKLSKSISAALQEKIARQAKFHGIKLSR